MNGDFGQREELLLSAVTCREDDNVFLRTDVDPEWLEGYAAAVIVEVEDGDLPSYVREAVEEVPAPSGWGRDMVGVVWADSIYELADVMHDLRWEREVQHVRRHGGKVKSALFDEYHPAGVVASVVMDGRRLGSSF